MTGQRHQLPDIYRSERAKRVDTWLAVGSLLYWIGIPLLAVLVLCVVALVRHLA